MRSLLIGSLFVAVSFVISSCGGSNAADSSASSSAPANAQDQLVAFARCMRDHGVPIPDPDPAHPGSLQAPKEALANRAKLEAAEQACRQYGGKLQIDSNSASGADAGDRAVRFAECLRQHGIDVADPQPGQSLTLPRGVPTRKAQQAIEECRGTGASATPGGTE